MLYKDGKKKQKFTHVLLKHVKYCAAGQNKRTIDNQPTNKKTNANSTFKYQNIYRTFADLIVGITRGIDRFIN